MNAPRRHMSMLRSYTPADALTIGNAACGTIAIFLCLDYIAADNRRFLWTAFLLLPLALVCDVLDGYVARLNKTRQSLLGEDLDSLADVISFGVAPAVLGFTLGLRGGWDMLFLTYFVVCGVSRLARFNVTAAALADSETGKVKYFEGTPIPTSILIVLLLGAAVFLGRIDDDPWFGASQDRSGAAPSAHAHLRRERKRDDQRHPANSEAVQAKVRRLRSEASGQAPQSTRQGSRLGGAPTRRKPLARSLPGFPSLFFTIRGAGAGCERVDHRCAASVTSSTARLNAASFARDGRLRRSTSGRTEGPTRESRPRSPAAQNWRGS